MARFSLCDNSDTHVTKLRRDVSQFLYTSMTIGLFLHYRGSLRVFLHRDVTISPAGSIHPGQEIEDWNP